MQGQGRLGDKSDEHWKIYCKHAMKDSKSELQRNNGKPN